MNMRSEAEKEQHSPRTRGEILYSKLTIFSGFYQNLPFLIIRIDVWAKYKLYSLGFLVKNVTVVVLIIAILVRSPHKSLREQLRELL